MTCSSYVSPAVSPSRRKTPSGPVGSSLRFAPGPKLGPPAWLAARAETYQPEAPAPALSRRTPLIVAPGLRTSSSGSAARASVTLTGSTVAREDPGRRAETV